MSATHKDNKRTRDDEKRKEKGYKKLCTDG